jgi:hypothetical protein
VTVPHLLVIDVTLGAVAILVATWIVLRSGRSAGPSKRHPEVAGLAGEESALGETDVPGFIESEDALDPDPDARGPYPDAREPDPSVREPDPSVREPDPSVHEPDPDLDATDPDLFAPDPGVRVPAGLEQAPPQVSVVADAYSGADDREPVAHEPTRPEQAPSLGNGVAGVGAGAHAPAAEPDGQPGADGTVASSGRVYSYYDGADQPMADYLAELGWSEESGARDPW